MNELSADTAKALRQIAGSIRLSVSEAHADIDVDVIRSAARQLEARAEMIEGGMG